MLLNDEEYMPGIVKWSTAWDATVTLIGRKGASSAMEDLNGSIPDRVPEEGGEVSIRPSKVEEFDGLFEVSWERLVGAGIHTMIHNSQQSQYQMLDVLAKIKFDRIVVDVPFLTWDTDYSIRAGDCLIRFTRRIGLDRQVETSRSHDDDSSIFEFEVGTEQLEGYFVVIVAPQELDQHRELAFALLSLLSLQLGDAVIGDIVNQAVMAFTTLGTEYAIHYPPLSNPSRPNRTLRIPRPVTRSDLDELDLLVGRFFDSSEIRDEELLPLRWYERSLRSGNGADEFLSAFLGIEALVSRLAQKRNFESPKMSKLRHKLVHGSGGFVDQDTSSDTRKLLARLLQVVLTGHQ